MSSLAAASADGYHRSEDGSKSGARASRKRTKPAIVRFALPLKCVCLKCGEFCGDGRRFDAKKTVLGEKVVEFHGISCPECGEKWVIRTDPTLEDVGYVFVSGLKPTQAALKSRRFLTEKLVGRKEKKSIFDAEVEMVGRIRRTREEQRAVELLLDDDDIFDREETADAVRVELKRERKRLRAERKRFNVDTNVPPKGGADDRPKGDDPPKNAETKKKRKRRVKLYRGRSSQATSR